jgi:hypothetical protein
MGKKRIHEETWDVFPMRKSDPDDIKNTEPSTQEKEVKFRELETWRALRKRTASRLLQRPTSGQSEQPDRADYPLKAIDAMCTSGRNLMLTTDGEDRRTSREGYHIGPLAKPPSHVFFTKSKQTQKT